MKNLMSEIKKQLFPILITILLVIQVALSIFISLRITNLAKNNPAINRADTSVPSYIENVSIDDDPIIGDAKSSVVIVEFGDYQCPFCKESDLVVKKLLKEYAGKISFVFRDFPLDSHPYAFLAANAADCGNEQGYFWEVHDLLYENQANIDSIKSIDNIVKNLPMNQESFNECISQQKYKGEIEKDIADGEKYQVSGVPTFFVNGHRVVGGDYEQLKAEIDRQLIISK